MSTNILITGSCGLIGSEVTAYFSRLGFTVSGIDNNLRATFFGAESDTRWRLNQLRVLYPSYRHFDLDIRDRERILSVKRLESIFEEIAEAWLQRLEKRAAALA